MEMYMKQTSDFFLSFVITSFQVTVSNASFSYSSSILKSIDCGWEVREALWYRCHSRDCWSSSYSEASCDITFKSQQGIVVMAKTERRKLCNWSQSTEMPDHAALCWSRCFVRSTDNEDCREEHSCCLSCTKMGPSSEIVDVQDKYLQAHGSDWDTCFLVW